MAVAFEARGLARRLRAAAPAPVIRTIGPGSARLPRLAPELEALKPAVVLVAGLAGGCAPDVRSGEIVVGSPVGPTVSGEWIEPEPSLVQGALVALRASALPHRIAPLWTVSEAVATAQAKDEIWRTQGAVAVDMESAHVLDWARRVGLPALAVRAVADGPRDPLPPSLARAVSPSGSLRPGVLVRWLGEPNLIGAAWRLWRRSGPALDHLARFLTAFRP